MRNRKLTLLLIVLFLPTLCIADQVDDCIKLLPPINGLLKNGTAVSVTHENKTRVYTTKGFFEFRTDSNTCTLFDSRKTIYDLYAEAFKSQLDNWNAKMKVEEMATTDPSTSKINLESLQKKLDMAKLIKTCSEVDSPPFRKKILDVLEKRDYVPKKDKQSPNSNPNLMDTKTSS